MKEEKTYYGDAVVYLKFLTAEEYNQTPNNQSSSVHCFPIKDNQILFTKNPRGIDIIGGHVEKGETPEQALIREAKEEASIELKKFELIGAIRVDNRDNPKAVEKGYPPIGYQLFYKSDDYNTLKFEETHECTGRVYLRQSDIKNTHHNWLDTHQEVLTEMNNSHKVKSKNKPKI